MTKMNNSFSPLVYFFLLYIFNEYTCKNMYYFLSALNRTFTSISLLKLHTGILDHLEQFPENTFEIKFFLL